MSMMAEMPALPPFVRSPDAPAPRRLSVQGRIARSEREAVNRAHGLFRWLLPLQAVAVIGMVWFERGRIGGFQAGAIALLGVVLAMSAGWRIRRFPEQRATLVMVGVAQSCLCLLLTWLAAAGAGAQIQVFVVLAFLSFYRSWRLLVAIAVSTTLGAAALALFAQVGAIWAVGENAVWLALECAALGWACVLWHREAMELCRRQDDYQRLLDDLDRRVADRTRTIEAEMQQRERTAEKVRVSERRHRDLIASLPIGVIESTRDGRVRFANPHLLSLVGLPANFDASAVSIADGSFLSVEERARLWAKLDAKGEVRGFGTILRRFDGSSFDVIINARLKGAGPDGEAICEGTVEDITVRKRAERELETLHAQLVVASRQAGMAEVASGVLHNVGNVLTSMNLIVHDVQDRLKATRLAHLGRVVEILDREKSRIGEYISADATGRQIPEFLAKLNAHLTAENQELITDVTGLVRHCEHIREIIVTQQGSSQLFGLIESLVPQQLFADALRLTAESMRRHGVAIEERFETKHPVHADRHKILQILVNLLKNAKEAMQVRKPGERRIVLRIAHEGEKFIALSVTDNGMGIPVADQKRIFQHGFTTKRSGHGFGLHSAVLAAREMGGDLLVASDGADCGATFTLILPAGQLAHP